MSVHFKAIVKLTSNSEIKHLIIPTSLDMSRAKYAIGSIAGKMSSVGAQLVHIHIPDFANHHTYCVENRKLDLVGRCVLTDTVTISNSTEHENFVGTPVPNGIQHCPRIEINLTNSLYQPLVGLEYIEFEILIVAPQV